MHQMAGRALDHARQAVGQRAIPAQGGVLFVFRGVYLGPSHSVEDDVGSRAIQMFFQKVDIVQIPVLAPERGDRPVMGGQSTREGLSQQTGASAEYQCLGCHMLPPGWMLGHFPES